MKDYIFNWTETTIRDIAVTVPFASMEGAAVWCQESNNEGVIIKRGNELFILWYNEYDEEGEPMFQETDLQSEEGLELLNHCKIF